MTMDEKRYYISGSGAAALTIPAADAEALLGLRDGECALLYIHVLRAGGALDVKTAAKELGRTEDAVCRAADALSRAGLLQSRERPLPGAEELPEYPVEDVLRRSREDPGFKALVGEARRVMGHDLSRPDLQTLFGIYDRLGLPGDVIMLLINHVAERLRRRYGEGRLPTMHAVEKEAFFWANREIFTIERAESFIAEYDRREQETEKLRRTLQIADRAPSSTERKYMDGWLEMGFTSETLALAYDRTVVSTGRLSWAYMDKIVKSWYDKGLFTAEAIEKGDPRTPRRNGKPASAAAPAASGGGDDSARLAEMLNIHEVK